MLTTSLAALFLLTATTVPPPLNSGHVVLSSGPSLEGGPPEVVNARNLLNQAGRQLSREQWDLLNSRLRDAEEAWKILNESEKAAEAARVTRAAGGIARAGRVVGFAAISDVLVVLSVIWPSRAEAPELPPETQFEQKLKAFSDAAKRVKEDIERKQAQAPQLVPSKQPTKKTHKTLALKGDKAPLSKQECIEIYNQCVEENWVGTWKCYDCFRYCEGQHTWPDDKCFPE